MHPKGPLVACSLVALVLLAGLLAGCGGGEGQSSGGSQDDSGQQRQGSEAGKKKAAAEAKIALGLVKAVKADKSRISLRLHEEIDGSKRISFRVKKKANIQLDGKPAELSDAEEGQQAQIEYTIKNDRSLARSVQLFPTEGGGDAE